MDVVEEGEWWEFAGFAGPRLDNITAWDKVALIGDASHPLAGECQFIDTITIFYH